MAQQQNENNGDFGAIIMLLLLVLGAVWVIWTKFHEPIIAASIAAREPLMALAGWLSPDAVSMMQKIRTTPYEDINFSMFASMMARTGQYVRWVYVPLIVVAAGYVFLFSLSSRFRKVHSMKTLVQQEKSIWPEIAPVANLDLMDPKTYSGKWGVSLSEREFVKAHKIIESHIDDYGNKEETFLRERAEQVFESQLGALWEGPERLAPHEKLLFAVFAMRIGGEKDRSLACAREAAKHNENPPYRFDYPWVDEAIAKHLNHELVQKALQRHAYVRTVLCTMLQLARTDGVFASALWIWLKPHDRKLFYALNCVGRYADFIEASGITAHWKAEKKMKIRIPRPVVLPAIKGTETALKDYCDDDYLEKIFE